jgi:peptidoglycan endopeptidase LytF
MPTYTVAPGDTLYGIARKFGVNVNDITSLNGLSSNNLSVGQTLQIPGDGGGQGFSSPPPSQPAQPQQPPATSSSWGGGGQTAASQKFQLRVQPEGGFNRYFLTVPLLNGQTVTANMRDNLTNSAHMVYSNGIMYGGQSNIQLDVNSIQSVGLTPQSASALQYVSTHEGKFDAINSYDKAIFSYGFIQFVGAAAPGGSLNRVIESMKRNAPGAFSQVFQSVGIDSQGGTTTVLDDSGRALSGDQAWLYIQQNVPLYGAFVQAGFDPSLVLEQLRMANTLYVQPALNYKLSFTVGGITVNVPRLQDLLTSEAILTAVIAIAINQGSGGMSRIVADAVSQVAAQQQISNPQDLAHIDQRAVCETIANTTTDQRVRDRANGVLNSGLSFT